MAENLGFLADEDLNNDIIRGLRRRKPDIDFLRVQDVGLRSAADPDILEWAAQHSRITITHDVSTMADFARERVHLGRPMPGLVVVPQHMPIAQAVEELLLLAIAGSGAECEHQILYLPI